MYDYAKKRLTLEGQRHRPSGALEAGGGGERCAVCPGQSLEGIRRTVAETEEERLARYREQLDKCKIYSPQDGMVAYYVEAITGDNPSTIKAGTAVRNRQPLMSIPDLTHMQVKTAVHESVVDRVKPGLTADIRLDAFPDRVYHGTVESVAVLPDPGNWLSSDTKVYETIVTIDEEVEQLKPGMTAVVEIHMDYLKQRAVRARAGDCPAAQ